MAVLQAQMGTAGTSVPMMSNLCDLTFSTHCSSNVHSKSNCGGLGEASTLAPFISKFSSTEAVMDKMGAIKGIEDHEEGLKRSNSQESRDC